MIAQQVNARQALAKNRTAKFAEEIGTDLARFMFDDPFLVVPGSMPVEGARDFVVEANWLPAEQLPRQGIFEDYQIDVDPTSMEYVSPQVKLAQIRQTIQGIMPIFPMLQQQGVQFDAQEYLKLESKYQNLPQLLDVFSFTMPPPMGMQGTEGSVSGGSSQPREYIRRNVSQGPTSQGRMNQAFTQQSTTEQGSSNGQP